MPRPISRSVGAARPLDFIRRLKRLACVRFDRRGVSILEFAIAAPVMLALGIGTFKFGVTMMHQIVLTNAAAQGATTLALQPRHHHALHLDDDGNQQRRVEPDRREHHHDGDDQRLGLLDQHGVRGIDDRRRHGRRSTRPTPAICR